MKDYSFLRENKDKPRLSTETLKKFYGDSFSNYTNPEYTQGGNSIQEQQRGLILPILEKAIAESAANSTVVEIGTGNGDVIAFLAKKYPGKNFIGVDFFVRNAQQKHKKIGNLSFMEGYSLDLLETDKLKGDIAFASSTFTAFLPLELKNQMSLFKHKSFKQLIMNEPSYGEYRQENTTEMRSNHLEGLMWFHNYCGYLRDAGYSISDFSTFHYKHPQSQRPDITVCLVRGTIG